MNTNKKGHLVLLAGASGVGKSTFAKLAFPGALHVSSDTWRGILYGDEAVQKNHSLVFRMVDREIRAALRSGEVVVCDQTALSEFARNGQQRLASQCKASIEMVLLSGSLQELREGQDTRYAAGGRRVPDEVVQKQFQSAMKLEQDICTKKITGFDKVQIVKRNEVTNFPVQQGGKNAGQQKYREAAFRGEFYKIKKEFEALCSQLVEYELCHDAKSPKGLPDVLQEPVDVLYDFVNQTPGLEEENFGSFIGLAWDNMITARQALTRLLDEDKEI